MSLALSLGLDPQTILELEPEELAGYLLADLNRLVDRDDSQGLNRHNYVGLTINPQDAVKRAVLEAWSYLEREGLIAPTEGDWIFVTRRGRKIRTPEALDHIRKAKLPREILHPAIVHRAWAPFIRGEYETAVSQAFKEVEIRVREAAGLDASDFGEKLMRKAFNQQNGPLADQAAPPGERAALENLFAGSYGYFRNPPGHRDVGYNDAAEAIEMIGLASHLARIVDKARERTSSANG